MKWKLYVVIVFLMIWTAAFYGIAKRQTYTDVSKNPSYLDNIAVAQLPERIALAQYEDIVSTLPQAPIILKVSAVGPIEHLFRISQQRVRIEEIYRGDENIKVGEEIYLITERWELILYGDIHSIERGFVNILKEGEEYLVFISEKVKTLKESPISIYRLVEGSVITPVFSYSEHENIILEVDDRSTYVPYKEVKENEFFAVTEETMEMMLGLKEKMMKLYP